MSHTIIRDGISYSGQRRKEILEYEWWEQIHAHRVSLSHLFISIGIIGVLSFNGIVAV